MSSFSTFFKGTAQEVLKVMSVFHVTKFAVKLN
jgi:hypothetical protein